MADIFSEAKRSEVMSKIRSENTRPEVRVRKYLHAQGFRYRLHRKELPGNPDIIFPKYKTAVFVHGCFWHGHPCKIGSGKRRPKTNYEYWNGKIERNIARDKRNQKKLIDSGWKPYVIWECETRPESNLVQKMEQLKEAMQNGQ